MPIPVIPGQTVLDLHPRTPEPRTFQIRYWDRLTGLPMMDDLRKVPFITAISIT